MPTIHAILIGINEYPKNPLKGCINDVTNIKTTLAAFCNSKGYQFNEILLTNASATRQNIIEAYQNFQGAQMGDTCLVYYSGHGYRIAANPSVWIDGDSFHEAIYTYDADNGGRGLVNKELAYLMWKNTQNLQNVHLVEIFDCCHAGGITRYIGDDVAVRTIPSEMSPLPQNEYLGIAEYINNNGRLAAPVAHRIQLAASTGKETSKELKFQENGGWANRGAFTTAICALLKEENFTTSYKDLLSKANIRVKNLIKDIRETHGDQSPQLDAERIEGETQVFTGKGMTASDSFIVGFSEADNVWQMQGGAIQSVAANATIRIVETSETFQLMEVTQNTSKVLLSQKHDRKKQYHAEVIASLNNRIIAAFSTQIADNERNKFSNALAKHYDSIGSTPRFFEKIEDTNYAQFLIHCENGEYYLTTKSDIHTPLFLRGDADGVFFESMEKVGKWFIVKGLENKATRLKDTDVTIELSSYSEVDKYQRGVSQRWIKDRSTEFHYDLINNAPSKPALGMSVKNNTGQDLWVSIVWLSSDFSITNKTLPAGKELVAAGNLVRINNGGNDKISIEIPKDLRNKGVLEVTEYLKVFISTDELNTDTYKQSALQMDTARARGMASNEPEAEDPSNVVAPDWRTYDVEIRIKMPNTTSRLAGGMEGEIANHAIVAPEGFSADISAGAVLDGQRSIGISTSTQKLVEADLQPYFLSRGMATGASQSTLSFKNVSTPETVSIGNSIKLSLPNANNKDEMVLALAYDAASGLYYPTGFQNENGQLEIHTLPEPTSDGQRSLGGAIVMFLQKVALPITSIIGKAKTDDDFYKLRIAKISDDLAQETEYEADKSKIKVEIAKAKKIIVFIHGIIGDTADQVKVIKRMNNTFDYDLVLAFDYESLDNPIQETAEKLKTQLANIGLSEGHGKELHFVVHSMGGLVSRWFIEQLGGDKIVTQLVMVGTPNNGSEISNVTSYVTIGVVAAVNFACSYFGAPEKLRAALSFGAKNGSSRILYTLSQMNPKGDFIKQLNARGADGTIPYHIIAGDIFAININIKDSGILKTLMHNIERTVGKAIYGEANDIAVRVDSIKGVIGVADNCKFEIPVDHTSYFADPKGVAQLEAVLIKINQNIPTVGPTEKKTEPIINMPETHQPTIINEANSLGFFARLIEWIKNLF